MIDYDAKSWTGVLWQLRGSVVPRLVPRILLTASIGLLGSLLFSRYNIRLPNTAHTLLAVALGLLLVFRTNASYDRYWEGRRILGGIVNRSRNLLRQATSYLEGQDEATQESRRELRRLTIVFYALLRQYLRKERDLDALGAPLTPEEKSALAPIKVRPNLAIHWLSALLMSNLKAGRLTEERLRLLDENVTELVELWGNAERILKTPIPFAYAQHIKGFSAIFCFTVPFALVESMKFFTPLASAVIAYGMFGIDEIGVELEDPFGDDPNDLPLDAMAETIQNDTGDLVRQREKL
jgi:ion channel-forming bestrophin family protein